MWTQKLFRSARSLILLRSPAKIVCTRKYTARKNFPCDPHMNELPIPCGPWDIWYSDRQSFFNKFLAAATFWWLFSLGMMLMTGSLNLNFSPPSQPGPPSDLVEECEDEDDL